MNRTAGNSIASSRNGRPASAQTEPRPTNPRDVINARRRFLDDILNNHGILRANGDPKYHLGPYAKLNGKRFKRKALHFLIEYYFWSGELDLRRFLNRLERTIVHETLLELDGNQGQTAAFLGLKPSTLCEKLKKYRTNAKP